MDRSVLGVRPDGYGERRGKEEREQRIDLDYWRFQVANVPVGVGAGRFQRGATTPH